ncbi:MAG TPA: PASTA domain-containing protein [Acidimicrobiales bacterium]|nr:PASTA domain-containing protein [Acidimicrobiales bacterium]
MTIGLMMCAAAVAAAALTAGSHRDVRASLAVPSVVRDRLVSAEREVTARGFAYRDVLSIGGAASFGPLTCHPAIVVGQHPSAGTSARRGSVVELLAGPGTVRCRGALPRGDGAVLGLLASSGAIWSGDATSAGSIVASSHVAPTGRVRAVRVGRTGVFELVLPSGEWHLTGFTRRLVTATGARAACDGGDVSVRAGRVVRANVVCVAL